MSQLEKMIWLFFLQVDRKRILREIVDRYLENKAKETLQEAEGALHEQYLKIKEKLASIQNLSFNFVSLYHQKHACR